MSSVKQTLWSTLLSTFLIFAIIPAAAFIIFEETVIQHTVRNELGERGRHTATSAAGGISLYLSGLLETSFYLAQVLEPSLPEHILAAHTAKARTAFPYLESFRVMDDQGIVVFVDPPDPILKGTFMGDSPILRQLDRAVGLNISPSFLSPRTGQPSVTISRRLKSSFVCLDVNLSVLDPHRVRITSEADFQLRLLDSQGVVIAGPDPVEVLTRTNLLHLAKRTVSARTMQPFMLNGIPGIGTSSQIESFGWYVLVSWRRDQFLSMLEWIRVGTFLASTASILLAFFMAIRLAKRFDTPIVSLARLAANYASDAISQDRNEEVPESARDTQSVPRENSGIVELGTLRDSLELMRRRTEERESGLKTALLQRDILLKEVHHRVKNNLQIVSSMLSLQQEGLLDTFVSRALEESRRRVQALSLIHETLYQTSNFAEVDFGTYASHLAPEIIGSYPNCTDVRVQVEVKPGSLTLPVDQAIPMGLILSELTSNAAKYAFTSGRPGTLLVQLDFNCGLVRMNVEDDGPGFDLATAKAGGGLGIVLIEALTAQVKGTISLKSTHGNDTDLRGGTSEGSKWTLEFPCRTCGSAE